MSKEEMSRKAIIIALLAILVILVMLGVGSYFFMQFIRSLF